MNVRQLDETHGYGAEYGVASGTSFAAPIVAGIAASYLEDYYAVNGVWLTPQQVIADLVAYSTKQTSLGQPLFSGQGQAGMVYWWGGCRRRAVSR